MIELGSIVRDNITGFSGIAISRTVFLHGCVRISIQPKELHDGKPIAPEWFDEQQVELVEATPRRVSADSADRAAGPRADCPAPRQPSR